MIGTPSSRPEAASLPLTANHPVVVGDHLRRHAVPAVAPQLLAVEAVARGDHSRLNAASRGP